MNTINNLDIKSNLEYRLWNLTYLELKEYYRRHYKKFNLIYYRIKFNKYP